MITGVLANFPSTEDDNALMTWCKNVHGQHSGDIPTIVKHVLEHQDAAEALGAKIKDIREALRKICNARKIMSAAIEQRKALLTTTNNELQKQLKRATVTFKAEIQKCLMRYVDTLSLAIAISNSNTATRPGEHLHVDTSSVNLTDGEPAVVNENAINEWLTSETGTVNDPKLDFEVDERLVTDEEDEGGSGPDSGELLL
ncbi:MAG: hypothetical protein O3A80_00555 [bacterium]|nr:hypothetical protein [bacterium]MDA1292689.1 hypothetical protein [bacterium]